MTTPLSDHPLVLAALQQIDANGKAFAAMRNRVQNDTRYRMLMAMSLALTDQPISRDGFGGAAQMMNSITSSAYWRGKRAGALALVREGQIKSLPGYSSTWLRKAVQYRCTERMYRVPEHMSAGADAINAALMAPYGIAAE